MSIKYFDKSLYITVSLTQLSDCVIDFPDSIRYNKVKGALNNLDKEKNMNIGNKIKQLRQKSSLTQEQLADKLSVSAQSVSKWENSVAMPDITLLPLLAGVFGVSIDELFDLNVEEKFRRIEGRMEKEEELSADIFKEYEKFLLDEVAKKDNKYKATSLLAHLYHHKMEADAKRVRKYAEEAIMMCPEKKDCQWLLNMAAGQCVWDWNVSNHAPVIDFYKKVIKNDSGIPKTPMPYYYLIDNLLADSRVDEAEKYVDEMSGLPAHNPILVPIYKAHIALAKHDVEKCEAIFFEGMKDFGDNESYLFEVAQYYAGKADYEKAIEYYEMSWKAAEKNKPRFIDTLEGIAAIYSILGDREKLVETYDRIIEILKDEWDDSDDDRQVIEFENRKRAVK